MRNFEERMIRKSRNLKHKRKLPRRVLIRLARAFDRGGFIPLFESRADNYAIEGFCAQWHLQRTRRKKGVIMEKTTKPNHHMSNYLASVKKRNEFESKLRMHIRNAWLAESVTDILNEARNRLAQGKVFEADCLIELALED